MSVFWPQAHHALCADIPRGRPVPDDRVHFESSARRRRCGKGADAYASVRSAANQSGGSRSM